VSPEAAEGGAIALVRDGDPIAIDIAARSLKVEIPDAELARRRREEQAHGAAAFSPRERKREISLALRIYALLTSSADTGAVRRLPGAG
jgi:dihydroxy-acid dehydratase